MKNNEIEKEPTDNKPEYGFFIAIFLIGFLIYTFHGLATMWDDHRAEIAKKFKSGEEIICHEGTRAHRVSKSDGWSISGEYLEKGEFLIHMNGCKLENKTEVQKR